MFLVAEPVVTLIFIAIAFAYILITAMGSMGSFIATTPSAIVALIDLYVLGFEKEPTVAYGTAFFVVTMLLILGIILLTWHAHRQNIKRLLAGEEHETGWLDMIYDLKLKKLKKKALKKEQNNKDK